MAAYEKGNHWDLAMLALSLGRLGRQAKEEKGEGLEPTTVSCNAALSACEKLPLSSWVCTCLSEYYQHNSATPRVSRHCFSGGRE